MRRREFIGVLGGVAAWPLAARAQQTKLARIGALYIGIADAESFQKELREGLRELGYVERQPDPEDRRAKLIVPTALGLDEMARSDAILAAIEQRHAQAVGEEDYATFKRVFQQVAEQQRSWRERDCG